jgi:hypothetical protein
MNDLTDGKHNSPVVTAAEVYAMGKAHGVDEERRAVVDLLNSVVLINEDLDNLIFEVKTIIAAGGHRKAKP